MLWDGLDSPNSQRVTITSIIRSIGSVFGKVLRVDYNIDSGDRGKLAKLAISIDLTKPLISKIQVDGEIIFVEYEGLPTICFHYGRYGHLQDSCPSKTLVVLEPSPTTAIPTHTNVRVPIPIPPERESVTFGEWMVVQRRSRRTSAKRMQSREAKSWPQNRGSRSSTTWKYWRRKSRGTTIRIEAIISIKPRVPTKRRKTRKQEHKRRYLKISKKHLLLGPQLGIAFSTRHCTWRCKQPRLLIGNKTLPSSFRTTG